MAIVDTDWETLFCCVDDFCQAFIPAMHARLLADGTRQRNRQTALCESEIISILIAFQTSRFRDFKAFYLFLLAHHRREFPGLLSYRRVLTLLPRTTLPLFGLLLSLRGDCTGTSFVDSTVLRVCHVKRATNHRVFKGIAAKAKSSMGWFFGFKLHLTINEVGELLRFRLTPGNVDDRTPIKAGMLDGLWGKVFGDKGYLGKDLFDWLMDRGVKLVTPLRKNMKNALMPMDEKLLLRKRSLIETVNDHLKNVCQIEHSRHRSPANFQVHLMAGLAAYAMLPAKPAMRNHAQNPAISGG
jgi:hypothetical protein